MELKQSYRNIFKGHNSVKVKGICAGFLLLVYICIAIGELIVKRDGLQSTFLHLSQARTWISSVVCHGLSYIL